MEESFPGPPPSLTHVAGRIVILKRVVVRALTCPPREMVSGLTAGWSKAEREEAAREARIERSKFWESIKESDLWEQVSPVERKFASKTWLHMEMKEQVNASWRIESLTPLLWSAGMIARMPPYDEMTDHNGLKDIPDSVADVMALFRPMERERIEQARDNAELVLWRSRKRQLIEEGRPLTVTDHMRSRGLDSYEALVRSAAVRALEMGAIDRVIDADFPAKGRAYRNLTRDEWREVNSISTERLFGLNWLCGFAPGNEWDETPIDT